MKHTLLIFIIIASLFSCKENNKTVETVLPANTEFKEKIDEYFSALNNMGKFNGVIYVSKNNKDVISKAYNLNPNQESTTYVTAESQFDIHSISKLMARYLIEKFELEGKVKKTQTINDFISDFPNGNKITINMLLNHTSGLPRAFEDVEGDEIELTLAQIIEYSKKQELLFEPGIDSQYSNVGYQIIYFIIADISKKTFTQCLTDEVFIPLGMESSGAHFYTKKNNLTNLAKNHEKEDTLIVQVDNVLKDELRTARVFSTAYDLNKFLNQIKQEPYATLLKNKDNVIEKNGGSDGIRTQIYTNLKYNYNFILLANYEEIPFQQTITDFINILEDKPYVVPKELNRKSIDLPVEKMENYYGIYSFPDMGIELTFKIENENFVVYQDGNLVATLKAETENTFFANPKEPESFEFVKNGNENPDVLMGWKGIKLRGVKK